MCLGGEFVVKRVQFRYDMFEGCSRYKVNTSDRYRRHKGQSSGEEGGNVLKGYSRPERRGLVDIVRGDWRLP